jgi:hypothetical protein
LLPALFGQQVRRRRTRSTHSPRSKLILFLTAHKHPVAEATSAVQSWLGERLDFCTFAHELAPEALLKRHAKNAQVDAPATRGMKTRAAG